MHYNTLISRENDMNKFNQAKKLEQKYNFLYYTLWGSFPGFVMDRYYNFCFSKRISPTKPSMKCGYITDWKKYGANLDDAIKELNFLIEKIEWEAEREREFADDNKTPFERHSGWMSHLVGASGGSL